MIVKGIITEDFVNYKKPAMTIMFPRCTFKCGGEYCQNSSLANAQDIEVNIEKIVRKYINNPITDAIVMQGLEPFESWYDVMDLVIKLREKTDDDIVIYTGFTKDEISYAINWLQMFPNIIVKFGRYVPNQNKHYDDVLGVYLASDNQYAEKIS